CVSLAGFLYAIVVIVIAFNGVPIEGWSSLMVMVLILSGIQMLMLGVFGEYLWRAFDEARGRPRYIIGEFLAAKGAARINPAPPRSDNGERVAASGDFSAAKPPAKDSICCAEDLK